MADPTNRSEPVSPSSRRPGVPAATASFALELPSAHDPERVWARLWDVDVHTSTIPLTVVTGAFHEGRVVGRTGLSTRVAGRAIDIGFDDVMVVDRFEPPTSQTPGRCALHKEGRFVGGDIEVTVARAGAGSLVTWRQRIGVLGVPGFASPLLGSLARIAYRTALRRILAGVG